MCQAIPRAAQALAEICATDLEIITVDDDPVLALRPRAGHKKTLAGAVTWMLAVVWIYCACQASHPDDGT